MILVVRDKVDMKNNFLVLNYKLSIHKLDSSVQSRVVGDKKQWFVEEVVHIN